MKKSSQNLTKPRKKVKFGSMRKAKKKKPSSTEKPLKINLPFEEALKIALSPKPGK